MKNLFNLNRTKRKPYHRRSSVILVSISSFLLFFIVSYSQIPKSLFSIRLTDNRQPQCPAHISTAGEKFMWYAPHSGFNNQLSEFKNALLIAGILNRTLIVPPILDHHAVALGSCPKFRVLGPKEIRLSAWDHMIELLWTGRYISIADIIDISSLLSASTIRTLDFRVFASMWCGVDVDFVCLNEFDSQSSLIESLKQCGNILSGFYGNIDNCLYALDEDCRTTVWTYQNDEGDAVLDSFQPDEKLKLKKHIKYVRKRRDVFRTLGPGSVAESAAVLAFGSLFTAPYKGSELFIDIHEARRDALVQSLIENLKFLPFVPEVVNAGKKFALETIKVPFLCAQLRLLDGQFKNHWKTTFLNLNQKLEPLRQRGSLPIRIFVMTDLPEGNWTGGYLGDLARDSDNFKLYSLKENDEFVIQIARKIAAGGHGLRSQSSRRTLDTVDKKKKVCASRRLPDVLLYIEEAICSCASLGFVGTAGSTVAENIELMRKFDVCSTHSVTVS
ncbi:hypothetical protein HS088_TW20G00193 [Tripterygium wilfordii]|uniref:O-fucosyltransferase family protein n=1 Tax=Tripterygium wilfordii TaxID=458696 RepID=A0A7J7C6T0_TRIWF|nr:O-fucosyltransferase 30-like [Tripterygium wilfordii]KAF5729828.1 hypothetical protein HS088_TW20G00193 [Tripterygium wilfordii]